MKRFKHYLTSGIAFCVVIFSLCASSVAYAMSAPPTRAIGFFGTQNSSAPVLPVTLRNTILVAFGVDLKSAEVNVFFPPSSGLSESLRQSSQLPVFTNEITEDSLENWFEESGMALIKSFADREFPKVNPDELDSFQIGMPVKVYLISQKQDQNGFPVINDSDLRIAPILDAEKNAVGAIQVELNTDTNNTRQVFGDAKLGQSLTPGVGKYYNSSSPDTLLYDSVLETYFLVKDNLVEPASAKSEGILLGSIPSKDFFILRKNIIGQKTNAGAVAQQEKQEPDAYFPGIFILKIIVALLPGIILSFSICYLVWLAKNETGKTETGMTVPG